jgi:hypothetical protein
MPLDIYGSASVNTEGNKATYSAGIELAAAGLAANATDIFQIIGSVTKIVKITHLQVTADATAASSVDFYIIKRTVANTGGTAAAVTGIAHDSKDPAYTAVVQTYSANPSALGAGQIIRTQSYALPAASSTGYPFNPAGWSFGNRPARCPTLRGIGESLVFNWGGQAINSGLSIWVDIEWTEEPLQ